METQPLRILLVEDDGSIARVLVIAMRDLGVPYKLEQAFSAEEGLEMWENEPYDLVLTDYNLRGMTGTHLVQEISARGGNVPTVLFTAYDEKKVRNEARDAGITRFITKPFIIDEFIDVARLLLNIKASQLGADPAM